MLACTESKQSALRECLKPGSAPATARRTYSQGLEHV